MRCCAVVVTCLDQISSDCNVTGLGSRSGREAGAGFVVVAVAGEWMLTAAASGLTAALTAARRLVEKLRHDVGGHDHACRPDNRFAVAVAAAISSGVSLARSHSRVPGRWAVYGRNRRIYAGNGDGDRSGRDRYLPLPDYERQGQTERVRPNGDRACIKVIVAENNNNGKKNKKKSKENTVVQKREWSVDTKSNKKVLAGQRETEKQSKKKKTELCTLRSARRTVIPSRSYTESHKDATHFRSYVAVHVRQAAGGLSSLGVTTGGVGMGGFPSAAVAAVATVEAAADGVDVGSGVGLDPFRRGRRRSNSTVAGVGTLSMGGASATMRSASARAAGENTNILRISSAHFNRHARSIRFRSVSAQEKNTKHERRVNIYPISNGHVCKKEWTDAECWALVPMCAHLLRRFE